MAKPGQNKNNKHAVKKPGEVRRVYWTEGISGKPLHRFMRYLNIDPTTMEESELQEKVKEEARKILADFIEQLPE